MRANIARPAGNIDPPTNATPALDTSNTGLTPHVAQEVGLSPTLEAIPASDTAGTILTLKIAQEVRVSPTMDTNTNESSATGDVLALMSALGVSSTAATEVESQVSPSFEGYHHDDYFEEDFDYRERRSYDSDTRSVEDLPACSASDCGYCGHCDY